MSEKAQSPTVPGETATQPVPQQEPHSVSMAPSNGTQTEKKNGHKNYLRTQLGRPQPACVSEQGRRPDRDGHGGRHSSP